MLQCIYYNEIMDWLNCEWACGFVEFVYNKVHKNMLPNVHLIDMSMSIYCSTIHPFTIYK